MRIKNNLTAIVFVVTVFCFLGSVLSVFVLTLVDKANGNVIVSRKMNWPAMYPFEGSEDDSCLNTGSNEYETTLIKKINNKILNEVNIRKSKIASYTTERMPGYMFFIEAARKYESFIKWNMAPMSEYNNIIERPDGHFVSLAEKREVTESAQNTIRLANFCMENNVKFLYVSAPAKICKYEDADISGKMDFVNQNADEFFKILKSENVDYYDFRKVLHDESISHHDAFFKTDGHWRPETGLWAARHILKFMNDQYKYNLDLSILNSENFKIITYPKWFLGSMGKKLTLSRAEPEDFNLLYPKYPVLINHKDIPAEIDETGDFSVIYNINLLKTKNYYVNSAYNAYPGGVMASYHNKLANNRIKILLLRDSFAQVVIPFLALGVKYLDILDLREFSGSVQTYIKINKPDLVMILYNINMIGNKDSNWTHNIFDFR